MSESPNGNTTRDFSRFDVLVAFRSLISRGEPEVAQAAIRLVGDGSPYLSDDTAPYWLGTVGVANPGLAQMNPDMRNVGGELCWRELAAVANSAASPETRALAIRAVGLVKARELRGMLDEWLHSTDAPMRAAAVLVLANFVTPQRYAPEQMVEYAKDRAPEVRKATAYTIGFSQVAEFVPVLNTLLHDDDQLVRRAARESLHSFASDIPAVKAALEADLYNPETHPLSLLALARNDPEPYLDALARVVIDKPNPTNWTGGQIPDFTAWNLLFKYLRARPVEEVRSGKWDRYLDALEQVGQYSSSEPRDLYAFYVQRRMSERATKYRAKAKKERTYDIITTSTWWIKIRPPIRVRERPPRFR